MNTFASNLIELLQYLMPGFLAAWVFYGFTSFKTPSQFERVVQALIFTLIAQAVVSLVRLALFWLGSLYSIGAWRDDYNLPASLLAASVLGVVFAYFANTDKFHAVARKLNVTKETSFPSEWFGVFSKRVTYVVLHLPGERRLYGWPHEWPSSPDKGHFSLVDASWLTENGEIRAEGVAAILVPATDVQMVEFMQPVTGGDNGKEGVKPAATT